MKITVNKQVPATTFNWGLICIALVFASLFFSQAVGLVTPLFIAYYVTAAGRWLE